MKNILMILVVSICTLTSQLLLKKGMMTVGGAGNVLSVVRAALTSPEVLLGVSLQAFGFILWLFVLTRANLGYAFGISGAFFYILLPILTWWLYGERLTPVQWMGMVFLCLAVFCLTTKS